MTVFQRIILVFWLFFIVYWAISAVGAKRSVGGNAWWKQSLLRLCIVVLLLVAFRIPWVGHSLHVVQLHQTGNWLLGAIGAALVCLGIGLAVFARVYLGRNWGMPMSKKEDPELVTGGPYAFVRHPIYTGIILAMLGSTIGEAIYWVLPLILFGAYFFYSARREEELMREQFGAHYQDYMRRTKMIVPFVL